MQKNKTKIKQIPHDKRKTSDLQWQKATERELRFAIVTKGANVRWDPSVRHKTTTTRNLTSPLVFVHAQALAQKVKKKKIEQISGS